MSTDQSQPDLPDQIAWDANVVPVYFMDRTQLRDAEPVASLLMVVTPTCRYGHGELELQPTEYTLRGLKGAFAEKETGERFLIPNRKSFRVALYRCPTCRYLEMFDPDPAPPAADPAAG